MPNKDDAPQFKQWFADMQERYQQYYGGYEDLLQEAFEAGAAKEREACAKVCEGAADNVGPIEFDIGASLAKAIHARGQQ